MFKFFYLYIIIIEVKSLKGKGIQMTSFIKDLLLISYTDYEYLTPVYYWYDYIFSVDYYPLLIKSDYSNKMFYPIYGFT